MANKSGTTVTNKMNAPQHENSLVYGAKTSNANLLSFIQLVVRNVPFSQRHRYLNNTAKSTLQIHASSLHRNSMIID